jgi:small conductance mechanosensitive channel
VAIWGVDTGALLVSAGIIALIIGLGAQSLISDIIAGLNIVFEDEYKVGDIVVVDDFRGTIQEIGLTTTKIMDPAGNVKIINNSQISTVVNLSDHPSVAACLMYIDYDEDLVKIEKFLKDNAAEIKKQLPLLSMPRNTSVSRPLQDGYIELKMICHCKEENRFQTERDMNRAYCLLFLNNRVDYPYNQLMIGSRAL